MSSSSIERLPQHKRTKSAIPPSIIPEETSESLAKLDAIPRRFFVRYYEENGRNFPWREAGVTPYSILLVEMMLRQTLAEMVAAVWPDFVARYSTAAACAAADVDELREFLQPLGLATQRATAIREVSITLQKRYHGRVPKSVDDLFALPHVGLYAAHAVACFAYRQRVPIADVNVLRLLTRYTSQIMSVDIRRGKTVWIMARHILPIRDARAHNYGLLDFCATVCKPREPDCPNCPLAAGCDTGRTVLGQFGAANLSERSRFCGKRALPTQHLAVRV